MFDQMFNLTPGGWRMLTIRWAVFFFAMAILNEIVWRTQTTDFWVSVQGVRRHADHGDLRDDPVAADQPLCTAAGAADAADTERGN